MLDFLKIATRSPKKDILEIYPKFIVKKSSDLMIRGGDFYAIWIEEYGLWSTDEEDVIRLIDQELHRYKEENKQKYSGTYLEVRVLYMWDSESGMIDKWHKYCQKQMRDNFRILDEKLVFANDGTNKEDYASKRLEYSLEAGDITAYDKLMSTLYSGEERHKLEWAIGAIVSGDSKHIQKFIVLYGSPGTGKGTVVNIIEMLFKGYCAAFDAKALGSANNQFALEAFKTNPLVAIQHDGDLSRIEDNTRLNSLVSHESMTVNEKFKSTYESRFKCFLFMGTNKPVKITDAKSGIIRRLIDVSPTGNKLDLEEYSQLMEQVKFELGAIAKHCLDVYLTDPGRYNNYKPLSMLGASNDFYNFVEDSFFVFKKENGVSLKSAWEMYKLYCDEAKVAYPLARRAFKEELKNYFIDYIDEYQLEDGSKVRNYYMGFKIDIFDKTSSVIPKDTKEQPKTKSESSWIKFEDISSIFDIAYSDCPAQYANNAGTPNVKWYKVSTKLFDLATSKLHYVKVPYNHIVIDFDIPDENGNKSLEKNLEAASKWPPTYAELSKSGAGVHLHYIYTGDVSKLSRVYDDYIEIKIFAGGSSLRRKLTKCNDLPIATISSGLPLKEDKMINFEGVKDERHLRIMIKKNLNKEIHGFTAPSISFIFKILDDAYNSGMNYDVSDLYNAVLAFAVNSSHQSDYCVKLVNKMKFKSDEPSLNIVHDDELPLVFYDVEVFPNLFLVSWKFAGEGKPVVRMINPKPTEIESMLNFKLVGFNNREYDNHILYARLMGYSNEQLYRLSKKLISNDSNTKRNAQFGEAFNLSYADVYDFSAKKQSLKKWEIELGISHRELGFAWDEPVPEDAWLVVAEYCDNDVIATETVFNHLKGDWTARQILAELANATVNDKTNTLTTKIIFGNDRKPQKQFNYRDLGEVSNEDHIIDGFDEYTRFNKAGQPVFPGYEFNEFTRKSIYRDEDPSEGGYVFAIQGIFGNVPVLDIASLHPTSIEEEQAFGKYTQRFSEIKQARIYIKHKDFENARLMLNGALSQYLNDETTAKALSYALKIAINSVYGLTSAKFDNAFKDPRNKDNLVAKRGALFMINLRHEVENRGFIVAHIKTDSIKIPDATPEIIKFVMDYGKLYGYTFEHEATYDRMCLVNDAVYIAKYKDAEWCQEYYGYIPEKNVDHGGEWTATGTQFQVPYIFKKLFSKEEIVFDDLCETKSVKQGDIYVDMNEGLPDVSIWEEVKSYRSKFPNWTIVGFEKSDKAHKLLREYKDVSDEELDKRISEGHNYIFVGRVGRFCPIKPGCGGGILYRMKDGKYHAVTGTKGYRWLESELVKALGREEDIDRSYYDNLVTEAANAISKYGDFEWFISDDPYISPAYKDGAPIYLDGVNHNG